MPFNISKSLIKKLPQKDQDTPEAIGNLLLSRTGGVCSLCEGNINLAAETVHADHVVPEDQGGPTILSNLALVHKSCNQAKSNRPASEMRPYLKFKRFVLENGSRIKYDVATTHFGGQPKPVVAKIKGDVLTIELPTNETVEAPILTEKVGGESQRYAYVELPRLAIFNDDAVQPRIIRATHAFSIYLDLRNNPLHEAPGCRLIDDSVEGMQRIVMFDGQHKTVASWMLGRERICVKLYLDLSKDAAIVLVNSIQAKIKKLPLSAFELSAKMSDEWRGKIDDYEELCRNTNQQPSEEGFLKSFANGPDKNRARAAFKDALVQQVLEHPSLRMLEAVHTPGVAGEKTGLTENMLKNKVIAPMLHTKPLPEPIDESADIRQEEAENIVWLLGLLGEGLVFPGGDAPSDAVGIEARRRLFKQASLAYVASMLSGIWKHYLVQHHEERPMSGVPAGDLRTQIENAVQRLVEHPVWTAEFDHNTQMATVKLALEKNQDVKASFEAVGLTLGYLLGVGDPVFNRVWKP